MPFVLFLPIKPNLKVKLNHCLCLKAFIPYSHSQPEASYSPSTSTVSHLSYSMTYIVEFIIISTCDVSPPRLSAPSRTRIISGS